jgi:hypothetical protein
MDPIFTKEWANSVIKYAFIYKEKVNKKRTSYEEMNATTSVTIKLGKRETR